MNTGPSVLWGVITFFLMVVLSAFFSSSETALFSLTRAQIDDLSKRTDRRAARLLELLRDPRRLLVTLLAGNTCVNIIAATIAALVTGRLLGESGQVAWVVFVVQVAVVTLIILAIGEVLPKLAAVHDPLRFSLRVSGPVLAASWLFWPILAVLMPLTSTLARVLGVEKRRLWVSEKEIKTLIEVGEEHGALEKSEREMIHSIFEFGDTTVREIMVPRTDMVCLEVTTPMPELLESVHKNQHTRIPIYERTIDNIIGIVHAKDFIALMHNPHLIIVQDLIRPAFFVPETTPIQRLLRDMQRRHSHMAIVVDEFGGTAGLITLEDIIEELVGEIQDEYDDEKALVEQTGEGEYRVRATATISDVNQHLPLPLPESEQYDTVAGLMNFLFGRIPEAQEQIAFAGYECTILHKTKRNVTLVRFRVCPGDTPQSGDAPA